MEEVIFPPSPSWFLPNIITAKEDGTVAYGSKNNIIILKSAQNENPVMLIIQNAHNHKVTSVAFSPLNCCEFLQNTLVSCSEDGFVKLWKIDTLTAIIGQKAHWEIKGDVGKVVSLDWSSANSSYVVSAAENNSLVLWDLLLNNTKKFCFQKNLATTVISCCPYDEKIVAVGGKTGQIHIISLTNDGDIIFKLRGHDNKIHSLSWCPVPYNVFKAEDICEEFLLASACQSKEIFVWRVGTDGKCEVKLQIPTSPLYKKDGQQHLKVGNSFSYSALLWFEPYKIYTSSNFGELIYFDIKTYISKVNNDSIQSGHKLNKRSLLFFKLGHFFHSKGLFAIAGSPVKPEVILYNDINVKSHLKYTDGFSYEVIKKYDRDDGTNVIWEAVMPETSPLLWTAGQDRRLISSALRSSKLEMVSNYHTINGFVYCADVSPHDPNKIAIGAGDGMIRLWNLTNYESIKVYWQKIKDRVMSLAWHPTKDGLLAYGTSEGRVGLIDTNSSNKLPNVFKPSHPHPIYSLSWGPLFSSENSEVSAPISEFDLYAVGDNTLSLYNPLKLNIDPLNLSKIIPFPCKKQTDVCWKPDYTLMAVGNEDGSICLVEPSSFKIVYTLFSYKKMIESIAWHPTSTSIDAGLSPFHGYFTSGSTDNDYEIRVFNCKEDEEEMKVEQVATLKGHYGHIVSVCWSPHISGRLISTSADFSVQIWDVISQAPLVNFTPSGMPLFSLCSPIDSDFVLTGCKNDVLHVWKVSAQTKTLPTPSTKTKKLKNEKSFRMSLPKELTAEESEIAINKEKNDTEGIVVAQKVGATKNSKESKIFSKAWEGGANEDFEKCYSLLKNEKVKNNEGSYSLLFLNSQEDLLKSLSAEENSLKKSNNRTELGELALWIGNLREVLEEKIQNGQLNDFLVSLAPFVGPRLWQEACISYSKTLQEKKMYRKAASYLVVCHKIYEAIQLLVDANLYVEALCIARSRLPEQDPVLKAIIEKYAQWLFKNGSFLKACECYIYLENYLEVAKICGKKSQAEYLSLAALAARKCEPILEHLESTKALFKCFETDNFELGKRICDDHSNLKHLGLLFCTYHTLYELENGKLALEKDFLSHVKESFDANNAVFSSFLPKHYHSYTSYKSKHQMLTVVAEELCFAVCSQDTENVIIHLVKALSTCCRFVQHSTNEVHPLYKLCTWLSPKGFLNGRDFFSLKDDKTDPLRKSMRAFLGAAIVRYLNFNQKVNDALEYLDILDQLKDDLLDKENYDYFKNLIEIEICEKRLLKNRNLLSRKALIHEKIYKADQSHITNVKNSNLRKSEKINGEKTENGFSTSDAQENVENLKSSEHDREKLQNNLTDEMSNSSETMSHDSDNVENKSESCTEDEGQKDVDLLSSLKQEVKNFEKIRISSPNPVPIYFMLKKLCERLIENETAKTLLNNLEQKWNDIN